MSKLACFFVGIMLGVAVGVAWILPQTAPGPDFVRKCRDAVDYVYNRSTDDSESLIAAIEKDSELAERWRITKAISEIEIND